MHGRPRILVLTPRYPYPVIGGDRLRIFELCRELAGCFDLTLLSLCDTREEMESAVPGDGVFSRVERVFLPKWKSYWQTLLALPSSTPLQVAYYRSREFRRRLDSLLLEHDLCLAHLIRTGDYVRGGPIPTVLEMTDAIGLNYRRFNNVRALGDWRSLVYKVEAERIVRYEREAALNFDLVSLVSQRDKDYILQGGRAGNVIVSSNGVDTNKFPFGDRSSGGSDIVFVGNMTSAQNLDACLFFATEVLPLVRRDIACRFRVVGKISLRDATRLQRIDGVEVRANVPNVSAAVEGGRLGVAPVRLGAGIQNKVLEYFALGLPVVCSTLAAEGLAAEAAKHVVVADDPRQWAERIVELWSATERRKAMASAGIAYVQEHCTWKKQLEPLVRSIQSLLADSAI